MEDSNDAWTAEYRLNDGDETTYAVCNTLNQPVTLILNTPVLSDKCRVNIRGANRNWRIDVYYDGKWNTLYTGSPEAYSWLDITYTAKVIDKARLIQIGGSGGTIGEFEFGSYQ